MADEPNLLTSYTLTGKGEILEKLRMMEKQRILLKATAAGSNSGFLTAIIKILPDKGLLAIDASADESLNKHFLEAGKVIFSCRVDGIDACFSVEQLKAATINGQPVFAAPMPDSLYWLQRRRYFRAAVPHSMGLKCHIPRKGEADVELDVLNISLEGVALLDKSDQIAADLELGHRFENCLLLPHLAGERLMLEVRGREITTTGLTNRPALRLGCQLIGQGRGFQVQIQKLLYELEMHRKQMGFA